MKGGGSKKGEKEEMKKGEGIRREGALFQKRKRRRKKVESEEEEGNVKGKRKGQAKVLGRRKRRRKMRKGFGEEDIVKTNET